MPRPTQITRELLAPLIAARGPVSSTELAALLQADRSTIVRALTLMGDEVVALGSTRSTRYVLRRPIAGVGDRWPVYHIDADGKGELWAELEAFHDRKWRVIWQQQAPAWSHRLTDSHGLWQGFPFFLADLRPQGFLGRGVAAHLSRYLGFSADPRQWDDDDLIVYLRSAGEDLPGNLIVGTECFRRAIRGTTQEEGNAILDHSDCEKRYPERARQGMRLPHGSSAGGEQPKFLATLRDDRGEYQSVLVKFSPPLSQSVGRRWADLLLCEFHALETLAQHGLGIRGARIFDAEDRRFLEVPRFDRRGAGGRRGVVSLESLHAAAVGHRRAADWSSAAEELLQQGWLQANAVQTVRLLDAFGEWIGNNDRHFGNLSFFLTNEPTWDVAPAYDMVPMHWAPGPHGEIADRTLLFSPPVPEAREAWSISRVWAQDFWQSVIDDPLLSSDFRVHAVRTMESVRGMGEG